MRRYQWYQGAYARASQSVRHGPSAPPRGAWNRNDISQASAVCYCYGLSGLGIYIVVQARVDQDRQPRRQGATRVSAQCF